MEKPPFPVAIAKTAKVIMAPVASLKADSLVTVWETLSFIFICLKMGTRVAGSVGAIVAPNKSATIKGAPKI